MEAKAEIQETDTGYLVTVPVDAGFARFHFENVEQHKSHTIEADTTVWQDIPGIMSDPFTARLNVLSLSQRDTFRRQLDDAFGKGGWTNALGRACQLLKHIWTTKDWSVDLAGVQAQTETRYLIKPLVLEGLPSVVFGPGGVGKTYLVLALAASLNSGQPFLDGHAGRGNVLMVDYESNERDTKRRLLKLGLREFGGFVYWPAQGRPLAEMTIALERLCRQRGIDLILVDSAALACGGDPKDEQVATAYFNALSKLGISSLTISHMTKDEKDDAHPFGSIYWFNSARLVWNVKGSEDDASPKHLGLFCRKSNEDVRHKPIGIRMEFGESVKVEQEPLESEFTRYLGLRAQIHRAVRSGAKSVKQLSAITGASENQVRARLSSDKEMRRYGTAPDGSGLWGLVADETEYKE